MRRFVIPALTATVVTLLVVSCQRRAAGRPADPPYTRHSLQFGGIQRSYDLWIPPSVASSGPAPLVLVLHGGGGNPAQACRMPGGVADEAEGKAFIVACPAGVDGHWNDGRRSDNDQAHRQNIDDVGFLKAVVQDVASQAPVDRRRVYVTGLSNGGMMTLRLACEADDTFAAFAAVIANLPADLDCRPTRPIPILLMNGTEDPLVPWSGGQVHFLRRGLGLVLSTESTFAFWVRADGCVGAPLHLELPDADPGDGTRVQKTLYSQCNRGVQVLLYTVEGGGHTMPDGSQYLPSFIVGRVSHDLDGAQAIWDFFQAAPLKG